MSKDSTQQVTEQFDKNVMQPARSVATLATDHFEALASIQMDAMKAYCDIGFKHARNALDVRDTEALREYVSSQPDVAKEFGERVKADAEKLSAANQSFVEKAQKVTQENVASVQKAAEENASKVQKAAEENVEKAQKAATGK